MTLIDALRPTCDHTGRPQEGQPPKAMWFNHHSFSGRNPVLVYKCGTCGKTRVVHEEKRQ